MSKGFSPFRDKIAHTESGAKVLGHLQELADEVTNDVFQNNLTELNFIQKLGHIIIMLESVNVIEQLRKKEVLSDKNILKFANDIAYVLSICMNLKLRMQEHNNLKEETGFSEDELRQLSEVETLCDKMNDEAGAKDDPYAFSPDIKEKLEAYPLNQFDHLYLLLNGLPEEVQRKICDGISRSHLNGDTDFDVFSL